MARDNKQLAEGKPLEDIKVSALIFTRQEEKNIKQLMENIAGIVDEIIIIDACSTDNTVNITHKYTNKIWYTKPLGYVEPCRMFGLSKVSHEWVLYLDADERLNSKLRQDLKKLVYIAQRRNYFALAVLRRNYIKPNKYLKHLFWPDFQIRIFRKDKIYYRGIVHEQPIVYGKIAKLPPSKYWINHYIFDTYTLKGLKSKLVKYAYLAAMQRLTKRRSFIFSLLIPVTLISRMGKYIAFNKAFLDGFEGIKVAITYIIYLSLVDIIMAFRSKIWDEIANYANTRGLSTLCFEVKDCKTN